MMKYLAIKTFSDAQDNGFKYHVGDEYPHAGYKPTAERIEALLTANNRRGCPMIEAVKPAGDNTEKVESEKASEKKVEKPKTTTKGASKPRKKSNVK